VGFAALLPYVAPFCGANFGGWLADRVIARSIRRPAGQSWYSIRNARRLCQSIDFMGGSIALGVYMLTAH
jgi:hypothetical protein